MLKLRNGCKEVKYVISNDEKVDKKFLEAVRKDIEDYKDFLIRIGRL